MTGQFAMRAGQRLQAERLHACHLAQQALGLIQDFQRALRQNAAAAQLGQKRMQGRKPVQGGHPLADLGIVLHGAGAQRVHVAVHAEVHAREIGEVPDDLQFGKLGQFRLPARGSTRGGMRRWQSDSAWERRGRLSARRPGADFSKIRRLIALPPAFRQQADLGAGPLFGHGDE